MLDELKEVSKLKEITRIKKASFKNLNLQAEEYHRDHKLQQITGKNIFRQAKTV